MQNILMGSHLTICVDKGKLDSLTTFKACDFLNRTNNSIFEL